MHAPVDRLTRAQYERIDTAQGELLAELEGLLRELETRVPLPAFHQADNAYRYDRPSGQQRSVMLLARLLTSLQSQRLLVRAGQVLDADLCARDFLRICRLVSRVPSDDKAVKPHGIDAFGEGQEVRFDEELAMAIYMNPGPNFQIGGVVASPIWYRQLSQLIHRCTLLIEIFAEAAVAFGHPGMRRYIEDCSVSFQRVASDLRAEAAVK